MYLVTGATGFVGGAVARALINKGEGVVLACREAPKASVERYGSARWCMVSGIGGKTEWREALAGVRSVIHCAGIAHGASKGMSMSLDDYREVNVEGTIRLASQAEAAGVRRFVFVSSIGVSGCRSPIALTEDMPPSPHDAYSTSKLEAERRLFELSRRSGLEVVVIRPPLVYGPEAPGSFAQLVRWIRRGVPLPLGAVRNRRSFVALTNLVDLLILCGDREVSPRAGNEVFFVSDGEDVSTALFIRRVGAAAGCPARLVAVSPVALEWVAKACRKSQLADRLLGDLRVDLTKTKSVLGWHPMVTMEEELSDVFSRRG
jgi:nucleoside-diphosphate-sugar epimerase